EYGPLREAALIETDALAAIQTVYDPEIPVDIHQLGLIYGVHVDEDSRVRVTMTLTSPACFAAQTLPGEVRRKVEEVDGVRSAKVDVVWDPPWNPSMMSEAARLALNMMW
ncbi:MAG: iron-sulfur cluster assembly protein, partial [Planctomycetota bacterium]